MHIKYSYKLLANEDFNIGTITFIYNTLLAWRTVVTFDKILFKDIELLYCEHSHYRTAKRAVNPDSFRTTFAQDLIWTVLNLLTIKWLWLKMIDYIQSFWYIEFFPITVDNCGYALFFLDVIYIYLVYAFSCF